MKVKYHILFWIIVTCHVNVLFVYSVITSVDFNTTTLIIFEMIARIIIFYLVLNLVIPYFIKSDSPSIISLFNISITSILLLILFSIITVYFEENLFSPLNYNNLYIKSIVEYKYSILQNIVSLAIPLPFAFAFYYAEKTIQQQESQRQIEQENFNLEQSIINTELNNLKNQINPDFLFRKLDYFYQESLPHSPSLSKGISLLSDMMHYAIDDDDDEGKVPLANEITHIRNFIEINQLRFDGRLQVDFEVLGEVSSLKIMPLILITFVENAFKYGELMDTQNPLKIRLELKENKLFFSTYNRTRRGPKEQSEGIGMANTQKRLALGYPKQHHLLIKSEIEFYEVELEIELT